MVHEMGDEAMVHEMGGEAIADVMKPVMDMENILHMENHMEMHHSKDNSNHVRLLLPHLSNLVSSDSDHAVMHDSDHTTTQPNGQSTSHINRPSKGLQYA